MENLNPLCRKLLRNLQVEVRLDDRLLEPNSFYLPRWNMLGREDLNLDGARSLENERNEMRWEGDG